MMNHLRTLIVISAITAVFFLPIFKDGKIALNGNFLVSFYAPWRFQIFPGFPTGVPAKQGGGYDQIRLGYPYFARVWQSWRDGRLPLWNPYNFSGLPLAAEPQSAAFYPLQFLSIIVSDTTLWNIFVVSGFLGSFFFMYVFLFDLTNDSGSSIFAAFSFAFSSFFIVWAQEVVTAAHAAMWLPLALVSIRHLMEDRRWWFLLLFSFIMSILSGYIQITIYVFIATLAYTLYEGLQHKTWTRRLRFVLLTLVFVAGLCSVCLTAFQLLPLGEMNALSSRTIVDMRVFLKASLLPWYSLIQFIVPEFFGSSGTWNHYGYNSGTFYEHSYAVSLPLFIFALSTIFLRKIGSLRLFFWGFFVISLLLVLDSSIGKMIFDLPIPVLSTSVANRVLFLPAFALSSLGALGLSAYRKNERDQFKGLFTSILAVSAIFLFILYLVYSRSFPSSMSVSFPANWREIALRNSILPLVTLVGFCIVVVLGRFKKIPRHLGVWFLLTLSIVQMGYFFKKVVSFSERRFIYPDDDLFTFLRNEAGLNRFWAFGDSFIETNLATQMKVYSPEGYDSLVDRRYAQLLYSVGNGGKWTDQISRSDANIIRQDHPTAFMEDSKRLRLLSLLSTRFIVYKPFPGVNSSEIERDRLSEPLFTEVASASGITIYQYSEALPRAYLVGKSIVKTENQEILDSLFNPHINIHTSVVLEDNQAASFPPDHNARAQITKYLPQEVVVETQTTSPQWLVLTDTFYPGWIATVDGLVQKIFRANFAFRAVQVPAGKHTVEFFYLPDSLSKGIKISLITAVLLGIGTIVYHWRFR